MKVRIDHTSRTLSFGSDLNYSTKEDAPVGPFLQNMPSEQIRNQLTAMSASLAKALQVIKPASTLVSSVSSRTVTCHFHLSRQQLHFRLQDKNTLNSKSDDHRFFFSSH